MDTTRTRLYDLAEELFRLAPWTWMGESQLVGLIHPETGELARISIMGAAGNHTSLALYLGSESLHRFNLIQRAAEEGIELADEDSIALILEARQLQASFTTRDDLYPKELREIKSLGRKYRGANWPCFRSFRPGRAPEPIADREEEIWLAMAMEQILAVAPVLREDPFGDHRSRKGGGLEHIAREQGKDGEWRTVWVPCDEKLFQFPRPEPSEFLLARVAGLPASKRKLECQFQLLPFPVGGRGKPGVFPYILATADAASGRIQGMDLLSVEAQTHEEIMASASDCFLQQWAQAGKRPAAIRVATEATRALLEPAALALGIPIERRAHLPALDAMLQSMLAMMDCQV